MQFSSVGFVNYRENSIVLDVDQDLSSYYQWFLTKNNIAFNKPRYYPHITIVRNRELQITDCLFFNQKIEFEYSSYIENDEMYYWISVKTNKAFEFIRSHYHLDWCYDKKKCYHITIGNLKGLV